MVIPSPALVTTVTKGLFLTFSIWPLLAHSLLEKIPIPHFPTPHTTNHTTWQLPSLHRQAHLLVTTAPWTLLLPSPIRHRLERTSVQSRQHQCSYAINAGPYHADGTVVGSVAVQGQWIQRDTRNRGVGWGVARDNSSSYYLVGHMDNTTTELSIDMFVTGFDWLVYQGHSVAVNNTTGAKRAPRTAIGVDRWGRLLLLVVDGCEWW